MRMKIYNKIRYVIQELRAFMRKEPIMMILYILCVMSSCIIIIFFFGFVHHMEQKQLDGENGERNLVVLFYRFRRPLDQKLEFVKSKAVTKGDLVDLLMNIDESIWDDCINIELSCKYEDDVVEQPDTDFLTLSAVIDFLIKDGKMIVPPVMEKRLKGKGMLKEGRYFTQEEYDKKSLVCIAHPENIGSVNLRGEYSAWWDKYILSTDRGTYIVDGKEFECIGFFSQLYIPLIPATVMRDDVFVMEMLIEFDHVITRHVYETVSNELKARYGDLAIIEDIEPKQADFHRFNSTITKMMLLVMGLSLIIISVLYSYMISRRESCFRVYRMCGMSNEQVRDIILDEATVISVFAVVLGILLYHLILLPGLEKSFEYLRNSAGISIYAMIGILFISISRFYLCVVIRYRTMMK